MMLMLGSKFRPSAGSPAGFPLGSGSCMELQPTRLALQLPALLHQAICRRSSMAAVSCLELELCNADQVFATVGNGSLHVTWVDCQKNYWDFLGISENHLRSSRHIRSGNMSPDITAVSGAHREGKCASSFGERSNSATDSMQFCWDGCSQAPFRGILGVHDVPTSSHVEMICSDGPARIAEAR